MRWADGQVARGDQEPFPGISFQLAPQFPCPQGHGKITGAFQVSPPDAARSTMMTAPAMRGVKRIQAEDRYAASGQCHAGGCAGRAQADDDDVMMPCHDSLCSHR